MRVVGIDTHKATLAACAIDDVGLVLAEATFPNDPAGFTALHAWLHEVGEISRIGLEGSAGYGAGAARYLLAAGMAALEVPPQLSHRERLRTRRAGKSDPGDALAIARVTSRETSLPPVRLPDASRELQLIVEAREDLVAEATRTRNRLHADLVVLVPGYSAAVANLAAEVHRRSAAKLLRRLPGVQAELARDRLARLDRLTAEARVLERRIEALVVDHPLRQLWGAGPLVTAKLVGEAGDITRFRSADAFAMLAGVAPDPSELRPDQPDAAQPGRQPPAQPGAPRDRPGQVRTYPPAQEFMARKRAEGKGFREALRALKRHLARIVYRLLSQPVSQASFLGA